MDNGALRSLLHFLVADLQDVGVLCWGANDQKIILCDGFSEIPGMDRSAQPGHYVNDFWNQMRAVFVSDPGNLADLCEVGKAHVQVRPADSSVEGYSVELSCHRWEPGDAWLLLAKRPGCNPKEVSALDDDGDVLDGVLRQLPVALAVLDLNRRIVRVSDAACEIVG